jgi:hypothetical protein
VRDDRVRPGVEASVALLVPQVYARQAAVAAPRVDKKRRD